MAEAKAIPAGVKKPTDRQSAKTDVVSKKSAFEWRGAEYVVDPDLVDDLEFFEALEGNQFATAVRMMLGDKQYIKFKTQVKEVEGRVSLATSQAFLEEYLAEAKRGK